MHKLMSLISVLGQFICMLPEARSVIGQSINLTQIKTSISIKQAVSEVRRRKLLPGKKVQQLRELQSMNKKKEVQKISGSCKRTYKSLTYNKNTSSKTPFTSEDKQVLVPAVTLILAKAKYLSAESWLKI